MAVSSSSFFSHIPLAPPDPILGITIAYKADTHPSKLDLGVGAYRTEEGKPFVLNVVRKAERKIIETNFDKEYIPIDGLAEFRAVTAKLILGERSPAIIEKRVATLQSLSGTGALRIAGEFIYRHLQAFKTIYVPNPTWGNHFQIFRNSGLVVKEYRYFAKSTNGLDLVGLLEDLRSAERSVIILHACAHNPTGVDPTPEQWSQIAEVIQEKGHLPLFDSAYQGFATGDLDADAFAVRHFVDRGMELMVTQSYAKNFGLYSERIGALNIVCRGETEAAHALSQAKVIIRAMYSSPPAHGARIVATILSNKELFDEWIVELKGMADRIKLMRESLYNKLQELGTPGDWSHIIKQIGMFTFTGLAPPQVEILVKNYHIYMLSNGRISMPGLSTRTVPYLANAIHDVVTTRPAHL